MLKYEITAKDIGKWYQNSLGEIGNVHEFLDGEEFPVHIADNRYSSFGEIMGGGADLIREVIVTVKTAIKEDGNENPVKLTPDNFGHTFTLKNGDTALLAGYVRCPFSLRKQTESRNYAYTEDGFRMGDFTSKDNIAYHDMSTCPECSGEKEQAEQAEQAEISE